MAIGKISTTEGKILESKAPALHGLTDSPFLAKNPY